MSDLEKSILTPETPRVWQAGASRFLSTDQLLADLPISRRTLGSWRKKGLIPYIKIGRRVLFDSESVRQALRRREREGQAI
jgi:predicted site-specific integrase-resolvase